MTFTGTASLNDKEVGYDIIQSTNAYSNALIEVTDKSWTNLATLKANLLKSVIKTHSVLSAVIFQGELRSMEITYEKITYKATSRARKLANQRANFDPVAFGGYFRQITYNPSDAGVMVLDVAAPFPGSLSGHLLHFARSKKDKMIVSPNDETTTATIRKYIDGSADAYKADNGAATAVTESGNIRELYNDAPVASIDNNYNYIAGALNFEDTYLRLDCYFSLRSGISIDRIDSIEVVMQSRSLNKFGIVDSTDDPFIGVWDNGNSRYEGAYVTGDDVGGRFLTGTPRGGLSTTPFFTKKVTDEDVSDFVDSPSTFITTISTTGEMTLHRMRLMVAAGQDSLNVKILAIRTVRVTMTLDGDQLPEKGVEVISTGTSNEELDMGGLGSDGRNPLRDGMGQNDIYVITDTLDDQINTLATAWSVTINDNITNSSKLGLTTDYTNLSRLKLFQDICDLSNSMWWEEDSSGEYYIVSVDNISDSGVAITEADIVNYETPGAWRYIINAEKIRDNLIVLGDNAFPAQSSSITPEFSHALGDEDEVLRKPDITSLYEMNKYLANEALKYTNAERLAIFTVDLDGGTDYSAMVKGQKISFVLESGTVANHDGGNSNPDRVKLVVTDIQFVKKPGSLNRRFATVTAQARYS